MSENLHLAGRDFCTSILYPFCKGCFMLFVRKSNFMKNIDFSILIFLIYSQWNGLYLYNKIANCVGSIFEICTRRRYFWLGPLERSIIMFYKFNKTIARVSLTLHLYKWQEQEMDRRGRGNPAGTRGHKGQALATIRDCLLSPCGSVSRNTINGTHWLSELAAAVGTFLHRGLLGEPLTARAKYCTAGN